LRMGALVEGWRCVSKFISGVFGDEGLAKSLAVIIVAHYYLQCAENDR